MKHYPDEGRFAVQPVSAPAPLSSLPPDTLSLPPVMAGDPRPPGVFIGLSAVMQNLYKIIESAAGSKATVFITGESGTGKDICAQTIHRLSSRREKPFVAINCAAIPRDLLESELFGHVKGAFTGAIDNRDGAVARADGGTLFLDEICDMAPEMQSKLLRFLQNLSYTPVGSARESNADIRVICATNKNPHTEIGKGAFREDLYYRLHVVPIHMPPLRGRAGDILDLADYYLRLYTAEEGKRFDSFSPEAEVFLTSYDWPGNVRELQNMLRYTVVLYNSARVEVSMLPVQTQHPLSPATHHTRTEEHIMPLWQVEKQTIEHAIDLCGGNIQRAAHLLEISPSTIYRKKMNWTERR